jgi:hypothetical protein
MGGFGSTRWDGHTKAATVEECRSLDVNHWARAGVLKAGVWHMGSWVWWRDAERKQQTASLGYEVNTLDPASPWLRLRYTLTRTQEHLDYLIRLQTTRPRFGGIRWWFTCPLVVNSVPCDRRVAKVYLPLGGRYYGCRHCHGLTYTSCQEHDKRVDLLRRNPAALRRLAENLESLPFGQLRLLLKATRFR